MASISGSRTPNKHVSFYPSSEELPLENKWCFWFERYLGPNLSPEEYEASLKPLCTADSVQTFWKCYNNLPTVMQLPVSTSYHLMKKGIKPLWEDANNANGGHLALKISNQESAQVWLQLLLAVIGEQFQNVLHEYDDVCGVTISVRKKESIVSLWNKNCTLFNQTKLLYYIQSLLPSVTFLNVSYRVHQNEANFKKELTSSPPHTPLSPMAKLSESPAAKLCDSPMAKLCDTKLSESPMSKLPDLSPPAAAPMHTPQTAVN